jgi:putative FmdB family regulatory protein
MLYEFECKKCKKEYEAHSSYDETGKYNSVKCPNCGSKRKNKLISKVNFNFGNPVGTDRWTSDDQGHDYRYKYNLPNVKKQREYAEKHSHVGAAPYENIDDVATGKHFGKVK